MPKPKGTRADRVKDIAYSYYSAFYNVPREKLTGRETLRRTPGRFAAMVARELGLHRTPSFTTKTTLDEAVARFEALLAG